MDTPFSSSFFTIFISIFLCCVLKFVITCFTRNTAPLPPGPPTLPLIGTIQLVRKSLLELEPILRKAKSIYGPIISLKIGHRNAIFVTTASLAHQALIHHGSHFADRPLSSPTAKIINSNQHNISSAPYGPLWRLLRRNLMTELLHSGRVKAFAHARKWVLDILIEKLRSESGLERPGSETGCCENGSKFGPKTGRAIPVMEHFQYAMFCLLVLMCLGEKHDEKTIRKIEEAQRTLLLSFNRFNILNFMPKLGKIVFPKRWNELMKIRRNQEDVLLPLIRARQEKNDNSVTSYVDTLLKLTLPDEEGRRLDDKEMVSLCSEFLNAGTDTTSTALQWIMAQLVRRQDVQSKLFEEVRQVATPEGEIKEEDLHKLPYLKAVVLEGLRRHPPGHFVLPHAVTEDIQLNGYIIPKSAMVNFTIAEIGWDPKIWAHPMEFQPERFLGEEGFDVTCSREIKMMPFGAGRRICPGLGLALMHLEYFVANLVMEFEWTAEIGDDVDLSEKPEFTIVMKNPLKARLTPRV